MIFLFTKTTNDIHNKDKLIISMCTYQNKWYRLKYNIKECYEKFDNMLNDIDKKYRTPLISCAKYKIIIFLILKFMKIINQAK